MGALRRIKTKRRTRYVQTYTEDYWEGIVEGERSSNFDGKQLKSLNF